MNMPINRQRRRAAARENEKRSPEQRFATTFHEAGHAVAAVTLGCDLHAVTTRPDAELWGHSSYGAPAGSVLESSGIDPTHPEVPEWAEHHAVVSLAGPVDRTRPSEH